MLIIPGEQGAHTSDVNSNLLAYLHLTSPVYAKEQIFQGPSSAISVGLLLPYHQNGFPFGIGMFCQVKEKSSIIVHFSLEGILISPRNITVLLMATILILFRIPEMQLIQLPPFRLLLQPTRKELKLKIIRYLHYSYLNVVMFTMNGCIAWGDWFLQG